MKQLFMGAFFLLQASVMYAPKAERKRQLSVTDKFAQAIMTQRELE
jgi:hypothetical protein